MSFIPLGVTYTPVRTFSSGTCVNVSGCKESEMSGNVRDVAGGFVIAWVGSDVKWRGARRFLVNGDVSDK